MTHVQLDSYGPIRRARFCYLYTQRGLRLTDLYQYGGRAILGWNCGKANTAFKNVFNRGVHFSPGKISGTTEEKGRLERAVKSLLPGSGPVELCRIEDIPRGLPQWRPWDGDTKKPGELFFLPPFPLAGDCAVVLGNTGCPPYERPPCVLAGITRSCYDLLGELPKREEAGWARYDKYLLPFFERRGPYLYPKMREDDYGGFLQKCAAAHLVISPDYVIPSIVPWGADPGSFKLLA